MRMRHAQRDMSSLAMVRLRGCSNTGGIPTGRWIIASHGNQCALEEGDCDVQCVEYVRNGPALYEYREKDRHFVRSAAEVTEPFRSMECIETAPFGAEEFAAPVPYHVHIPSSRMSCMDVIQSIAYLDSPGHRINFLRDQTGSANELMRILESRP